MNLRWVGSPWPWIAGLALLGVAAYVDVRVRLSELAAPATTSSEIAPAVSEPAAEVAGEAPPSPPEPGDRVPQDCTGQFPQELLRPMLASRGQRIFECYERREDPALAGVLEIRLRVAGSGEILENTLIGSPARDAGVRGCLAEELTHWRFEPIGTDCAVVSLPFAFGGQDPTGS
jgi:hypothetical protein